MSIYLRNFIRFIILMLIQVLLLNNVSLQWWANPKGFPTFVPYIYPLFLLLMPINTPKWLQLICGFILGLSIDTFCNTGGIHAAICVLTAFIRPEVLNFLLPKKKEEYQLSVPSIEVMGWVPFLSYAAIMLTIHLLGLAIFEIWSFRSPLYVFLKVLATLTTSLIFVFIYSIIFSKSINTKYREVAV